MMRNIRVSMFNNIKVLQRANIWTPPPKKKTHREIICIYAFASCGKFSVWLSPFPTFDNVFTVPKCSGNLLSSDTTENLLNSYAHI